MEFDSAPSLIILEHRNIAVAGRKAIACVSQKVRSSRDADESWICGCFGLPLFVGLFLSGLRFDDENNNSRWKCEIWNEKEHLLIRFC